MMVLEWGGNTGEGQSKPEIQVEQLVLHSKHSIFIKHYRAFDSVLGSGDIPENKADKNPYSHGVYKFSWQTI